MSRKRRGIKMVEDEWCCECNRIEKECGYKLKKTLNGKWICPDCQEASP